MLHGHPLTSKAHQHDEHLHLKPFAKRITRRNQNQMGHPRSYVIIRATKINWEGEPKRQTIRGPSRTLARLND